MSLPSFSIRRPVTTLMLYSGIVLFGIISASFLKQELFPPVIYPKLSVITNYANAAPQEIETLITKPVEEAVGSTPGLRGLTSVSKEGLSVVIAEFGWEQNMDFAGLAVREKIDLVKARLPRDASEPTVVKFNPFELPVMVLSVASDTRDPVKLKRFAKKWIKAELEKVNGVASATISGGADEEILVEVDQGRLKISSVGLHDVQKALSEANLNYPGGTIKESFYEYLVRTMGEFKTVDEINQVAVAKEEPEFANTAQKRQEPEGPSNELVVIKDLAKVTRQNKERSSFSRFNQKENLTISVQKQAQANTIQVVNEVLDKLEEIIEQAPEDIKIDVIDNQAIFIKDAINGVRDSAVQGGFLAFLILLIFLKNIRISFLVCIIIPITVLATFTVMYFRGISLNVISLGGIALGVGMLVDAAIVVIENVTRHQSLSDSKDIRRHAIRGSEEVIAPLIASTLTTVMVFLPMIFITGIAGQIFKELAMVVVITQLFSLVVSITLLPMLIVQFNPKKVETENPKSLIVKVLNVLCSPFDIIESVYKRILPAFIRFKVIGLLAVLVVFILSIYAMGSYDKIVMPRVDQGQFTVKLDLPVGTRVERTNAITTDFERYLRSLPDVDKISTIVGSEKATSNKDLVQSIGSHQARMIVALKPDRKISTQD
ncbi:MAG: efflux RND transporter permease subunit, partial [Candidatus Omnitrophica bacterium]|nr:efflux RND transporter permease subunit [Candidatus Omnitrophota bacterium]